MTKSEILQKLAFDLEARGRNAVTIKDYVTKVRLYQDHFDKPADQMGEAEIMEYQRYLLTEKKLSPSSANTYNSALRFVYGVTLDIALNYKKLPRLKQIRDIPILPTKEELRYLFYLVGDNLRNKALFMTIYGSGLRLSEAANLKVTDIDSDGGRIFIRKGKGSRDRYAILPKKTLEVLREYWNLMFHPHVHIIIPSGGLTATQQWRNSRKKFFIPVRVLGKLFRGKFLYHLTGNKERLTLGKLQDGERWQSLINSLYAKEWYVYCKKPFKTTNSVFSYLGRYTHRVAISNHRILSIQDGKVTFKWRDYKDKSKEKVMTLSAGEFMRRFLLHILPPGFMKIRHYGFLGSAVKRKN